MFDQYKDVLGVQGGPGGGIQGLFNNGAGNIDLNNLSSQAKQLLNQ